MNEDETPIESDEPSTDNIPASDGGVTVTNDEVADILNLPKPVVSESDDEDASDEDADDEEQEDQEDVENAEDSEESDDESDDSEDADDPADKVEDEDADDANDDADAPSFDLEVEDANGNKFTLKPGDDLEKVLDEFEPKSNGQIFKILNEFQKLETAKAEHDQQAEYDKNQKEHEAQLAKIDAGWQSEIKELQAQKRLEVTADGKQSDRVKAVFEYMSKENDRREEKDLPLIRSFEDALDKLELREHKEAEAKKAKEEKETARKKGSIVGGSSAPATSGAPVYRGGARNAVEAARQAGLLK